MPYSKDEHTHGQTVADAKVKNRRSRISSTSEAENAEHISNKQSRQHKLNNNHLIFYPAFCYKISPTWFTWVKLTAWQIHYALQSHESFHAPPDYNSVGYNRYPPLLLFYLNHPIQFVQVVGVVVSREDYFEKFWMFTVDDSSGATIDVTCPKPEKNETAKNRETTVDGNPFQSGSKSKRDDVDEDSDKVDTLLASARVSIGTVVQAKGTMTTFRQIRQLNLHRLAIVPSTAAEISLISARTAFQTTILDEPWLVDSATQEVLKKHARGEADEGTNREKRRKLRDMKKKLREERHAMQIAKAYEEEETERHDEAEKAKRAGEVWRLKNLRTRQVLSTSEQTISDKRAEEHLDEKTMLLKEAFGR